MGRKAQALSMAADTAAMHMGPFRRPILIVAVALATAVSGGALLHASSSSDVPSSLALVDDSSGTSTSPPVVETTSSTSSTSSTTQATSTTTAPAPSSASPDNLRPNTPASVPKATVAPTTAPAAPPSTAPVPAPPVTVPPVTVGSLSAVALAFEEVAVVVAPSDLVSRHGSGLLFVAERGGTVRSVDPVSGVVSAPLVDVSGDLSTVGERGLLGLAFSPDGARLYVSFNPADGDSRIDEFAMVGDVADVGSRRTVITVAQPAAGNHKGGHVAFGPDGMLWWGLGDGGGQGDPFANGQNVNSLLGGMVRIDPSGRGSGAYSVPGDNPWVGGGGAAEKWLSGLRNPWRFSFDRATGDLWIGDVGQAAWEEIDFLAANSRGSGANLGWPLREGTHEYTGAKPAGGVDPIFEYSHANGCSITGGYVYRGTAIAELRGTYLYTDYCTSTLRGIRRNGGRVESYDFGARLRGNTIATFGEGPDGEIYALSLTSGAIGRIIRR